MKAKTKTNSGMGSGEFVDGWEKIGAVLGVSGKTVRRALAAGNKTLKKSIRNTNPGGKRKRPIALRATLLEIRGEVFPNV